MRKQMGCGFVFSIMLLFSALGIAAGIYFGEVLFKKPLVEFKSEKGIQYIEYETPIFQDNSYRSRIIGTIAPREVDVLDTYKGWRMIETEYGVYWIPPTGIVYDFDTTVMLDVPVESQFPELENGCEAVAALMMLEKYGVTLDKVEFAESIPKDSTPIQKVGDDITVWGDPEVGFVGDIKGNSSGYSINPKPLNEFLRGYVENPVDLTGVEPETLEKYIRGGNPVVTWTTVNFRDRSSYEMWMTPSGKMVNASFNIHAMTMVGFDENHYYFNDPYTGTKNYKVTKSRFYEVWSAMGKKAISME